MTEITYIGFAIMGLFTGIGTIMGQWIFKRYIEPHLDMIHKRISYRKNRIIKLFKK